MRFNKANQLTVSGRVGNVNVQQGNSGPYGSLSIAVDTGYKGRDGNWVEDTSWVTVEFGGSTGAFVADKGVGKGDLLVVEGSLFESKWKDKDGADRSALKVRADRIAEHIPSVVFECLKANGFFGNQQAQQQAPASQQQPRQNGNSQQQAPAQQQRQQAPATGRNGNGYQPRQSGNGQQPQNGFGGNQNQSQFEGSGRGFY